MIKPMEGGSNYPFSHYANIRYYGRCDIMEQTYHYKKSRSYTKKDGSVSFYDKKVKYKRPNYESDNMNKKGKVREYYRLGPVYTKTIDKKINKISKIMQMNAKLFNASKYIKANGLYSHQEMATEDIVTDQMKCPDEEKKVLTETWHARQNGLKLFNKEYIDLLSDLREFHEMQNDDEGNDNRTDEEKDKDDDLEHARTTYDKITADRHKANDELDKALMRHIKDVKYRAEHGID